MKTKNPAHTDRHTFLIALCAFALLGSVIGCTGAGSDIPEDPPRARVIYLNEIAQLPSLEVYANAAGPTPVMLGELTEELELATGTTQFVLTAPGSKEPIVDETLELADQLYLITFTGKVADGNLALWAVDQQAPELASGQTAIEVVNLYGGDPKFDVYFDDEPLALGIGTRAVSPFTITVPASGTIRVFNAGNDPASAVPLKALPTVLEDGRALMVLVKNAPDSSVALDTLVVH